MEIKREPCRGCSTWQEAGKGRGMRAEQGGEKRVWQAAGVAEEFEARLLGECRCKGYGDPGPGQQRPEAFGIMRVRLDDGDGCACLGQRGGKFESEEATAKECSAGKMRECCHQREIAFPPGIAT